VAQATCSEVFAARLYLAGMTGRIGSKGQVVIPKPIRERLNLQPGDDVDFEVRDEQILVVARSRPAGLGGRFGGSGMAGRLLEDRAREPR
jgi:AbrB family looped-hinge helix DNA binding protein